MCLFIQVFIENCPVYNSWYQAAISMRLCAPGKWTGDKHVIHGQAILMLVSKTWMIFWNKKWGKTIRFSFRIWKWERWGWDVIWKAKMCGSALGLSVTRMHKRCTVQSWIGAWYLKAVGVTGSQIYPWNPLQRCHFGTSILFLDKFNIIWVFYRFGIDCCFFSRVPDEAVGLHLEAMFYWKYVSLNTRITLGVMRRSWYRRHLETESDGENSSFRTPTLCSLLCVCGKNWKMNMHKVNLLIIWLQGREQRRDPVEGEGGGIIQG